MSDVRGIISQSKPFKRFTCLAGLESYGRRLSLARINNPYTTQSLVIPELEGLANSQTAVQELLRIRPYGESSNHCSARLDRSQKAHMTTQPCRLQTPSPKIQTVNASRE